MQDEHNADESSQKHFKQCTCTAHQDVSECTALCYNVQFATIHSMRLSVKIESAIPAVLDCEKLSNHCGSDIRSPQNK